MNKKMALTILALCGVMAFGSISTAVSIFTTQSAYPPRPVFRDKPGTETHCPSLKTGSNGYDFVNNACMQLVMNWVESYVSYALIQNGVANGQFASSVGAGSPALVIPNSVLISNLNSAQLLGYTWGNMPQFIGDISPPTAQLASVYGLKGISCNGVKAHNLSGSITVSDTSIFGIENFPVPEDDANFQISPTINSLLPGHFSVNVIGKGTYGFVVQLSSAPGSGNSITVDWQLMRCS